MVRKMTARICLLVAIFVLSVASHAQQNFRSDSEGAGGAKIGMTVAQARTAMKDYQFSPSSNGEGIALLGVTCRGARTMTLYAGEDFDVASTIDFLASIETIEVWGHRFKTAEGVHVAMRVVDAERRLGKIKEIILTPIESREFITFSRSTPNIGYRFFGGFYASRGTFTTEYEPGARLWSIQVQKDEGHSQPEA